MRLRPTDVQKVYLILVGLNTLAASLIWGINTLFLLDAGLSNAEAFAANAFFTAGMLLFEVPTGVIADTIGRRASYLLGAITLAVSTLLYLLAWQMAAPFWVWAATSMLLGLGFTFFSGAVEAWLVDALQATGFKGTLESVFAKGQIVAGIAMLSGSVAGGVIAQLTNLGVPYILRALLLVITFVVAFVFMRDLGFVPERSERFTHDVKKVFTASITYGLRNPPVRWLMCAAPFVAGVGIYVFYAAQPYLLELYGDTSAYTIAGLAAAITAGAQIAGGLSVSFFRRIFARRTSLILLSVGTGALLLCLIGLASNFWVAIAGLVVWAFLGSAAIPFRQAYLNGLIPSKQRATVLSFDSLMGSSGGVVIQPVLGKTADVWSYGTSFVVAAGIQVLALPFIALARREHASSDKTVR